jgi:hypothetical protein
MEEPEEPGGAKSQDEPGSSMEFPPTDSWAAHGALGLLGWPPMCPYLLGVC